MGETDQLLDDLGDSQISIEGLKLIRLNTAGIKRPDDPSYSYLLEVNLCPPELMSDGGSEEIIVRGKTREVVDQFIELNNLRRHPRLRWMAVTGPDGTREKIVSTTAEKTRAPFEQVQSEDRLCAGPQSPVTYVDLDNESADKENP